MKKIILASVLAFGFAYASEAATELEHANKPATSAESTSADMSKMKAAGKCGADQKGMDKSKMKAKPSKTTKGKAATELEHANKTASSVEGVEGKMKKMKAAGKCNSGQ
jgi:predicted HD phosphohydrolase